MPKQPTLAPRGRKLFEECRGGRRTGREAPTESCTIPKAAVWCAAEPHGRDRLAFEADPDREFPLSLSEALALHPDDPGNAGPLGRVPPEPG